jgi:hypothetical protein
MKGKSKRQQPEKKGEKHKKEQKTKPEHRKGYKPRKREEEERERLTRRMLEEAARLAHSDASKTFRGNVWRQGIGQIAGMRHSPKPLFAGFGGGGPGSASLARIIRE